MSDGSLNPDRAHEPTPKAPPFEKRERWATRRIGGVQLIGSFCYDCFTFLLECFRQDEMSLVVTNDGRRRCAGAHANQVLRVQFNEASANLVRGAIQRLPSRFSEDPF
jgi:hypothetical protein